MASFTRWLASRPPWRPSPQASLRTIIERLAIEHDLEGTGWPRLRSLLKRKLFELKWTGQLPDGLSVEACLNVARGLWLTFENQSPAGGKTALRMVREAQAAAAVIRSIADSADVPRIEAAEVLLAAARDLLKAKRGSVSPDLAGDLRAALAACSSGLQLGPPEKRVLLPKAAHWDDRFEADGPHQPSRR